MSEPQLSAADVAAIAARAAAIQAHERHIAMHPPSPDAWWVQQLALCDNDAAWRQLVCELAIAGTMLRVLLDTHARTPAEQAAYEQAWAVCRKAQAALDGADAGAGH